VLTLVAMRLTRQPARRQRLGEFGMTAALVVAILSLGPAWLFLSVPTSIASADPAPAEAMPLSPQIETASSTDEALVLATRDEGAALQITTDESAPPVATNPPELAAKFSSGSFPWLTVFASSYGLGAVFLLGRWLLGYLGLLRLLRTAESAPVSIHRLFAAMATEACRPHLFVSRRVRVPLS